MIEIYNSSINITCHLVMLFGKLVTLFFMISYEYAYAFIGFICFKCMLVLNYHLI